MNKNSDSGKCVVLVCVTNKNTKILTHDKFFKIFSAFGKIQRILIFERGIIWKTFVEFDNPESAQKARVILNGQDFGEDGLKMNVYASQLERINFQENNSGGVDYTILRQKIEEKNQKVVSQGASSPMHPSQQIKNNKVSQSAHMPYPQIPQNQNENQFTLQPSVINSVPLYLPFGQNYQNGQYQILQHQIQLHSFMQQQVQMINQLMFMLQQINTEQQFQLQYNIETPSQNTYERTMTIMKELVESQLKLQQLTDQYQRTTIQQNSNGYFQYGSPLTPTPITPNVPLPSLASPQMQIGQINNKQSVLKFQNTKPTLSSKEPNIDSSDNNNGIKFIRSYEIQQQDSLKKIEESLNEEQILKQANKDNSIVPITAAQKKVMDALDLDGISVKDSINGDSDEDHNVPINYINSPTKTPIITEKQQENHENDGATPSTHEDAQRSQPNESIKQQELILQKPTSKPFASLPVTQKLNHFSPIKIEQKQNDQDEEDKLFSCFVENGQKTIDAKQIFQRMNIDLKRMEEGKQQSVVAMIENQIQQNSLQKSSNSLEQIDQLINKNKLKQQEIIQSNILPISSSYLSRSATSQSVTTDWGKTKIDSSQQIYEDINENLDPAEYVNPLFLKVVRKSKVIYARWFDKKIVTLNMLYNIFSTFGNINKMIYLKERSSALIQYISLEHATQAKESLNDCLFYGQMIKIFYSNYEEIFLKSGFVLDPTNPFMTVDSSNGEEYFQGSPETQRFKDDQSFQLVPPTDTIIVSNLTEEYCEAEKILPIFQVFGNILEYKILLQNVLKKHLCILKYENVETSLIVLANLHNTILDGRTLQISFSKFKISDIESQSTKNSEIKLPIESKIIQKS